MILVCSTIKILHDLSSNRREPDWFLSLLKFYKGVRKDIYKIKYFLL